MPARKSALAAARINKDPDVYLNSGTVAHPFLGFLGDVLIVLGAFFGAHRITGSRLPSRKVEADEDSNAAGSWEMIEAVDERS